MLLTVSIAFATPHHDLEVVLVPETGTLSVVDRITGIPTDTVFALHAGLAPTVVTRGWTLARVGDTEGTVPLEQWRLTTTKKKPRWPVELRYAGPIVHPIATQGEEYQRSFSETPGTIGTEGVFLARSSYWMPEFDEPVTFTMRTTVPDGWSTVSSGNPTDTGWNSADPMDEVYLIAAKWTVTRNQVDTPSGPKGIDIFLREPDPGLAFRYTAATGRYLTLYESMLTPYPFERFALVENFWETGYGMPGFTLLGPQVIRFPWVLTSSYPHEILHTWWGNSATVAATGGNWSEGLTAYMADHLFATHRGQDDDYRRSTLKKFTDIAQDSDFPLVEFRGRTSSATEAVGYGKSLLFWHMVRRKTGDDAFLQGLAEFHTAYRFKPAGFADLEPFLSKASGQHLAPFFAAWTTSVGAVHLGAEGFAVTEDGDGWRLTGTLTQTAPTKPAPVPLWITTAAGRHAVELVIDLAGERTTVDHRFTAEQGEPLRVDVDPAFEVMRILSPLEVPPALTSVFGESEAVFVLPSKAPEPERQAWKELATAWAKPGAPTFVEDSAVVVPPAGSWVLGWTNHHGAAIAKQVESTGAKLDAKGLVWEGETFDRSHSTVVIARSDDPARAVGWVTAGQVPAIAGLARKLPHYTKYSLLAFSGDAPENVAKATWQATTSPLTLNLGTGPLPAAKQAPPRPALAEMPPRFDAASVLADARWFGDPEREGRGLGSKGLAYATERVIAELTKIGLEPERQAWTETVDGTEVELTNVVVTLPGAGRPLPPVVVMAHLDHLGMGGPNARSGNEGMLHPGADDNASGVAVGLAVLRYLASEPARPRPVTFVFTTAEESGLIGAEHWLGSAKAPPFACIALDTVGRLAEAGKLTVAGAETAKEFRFLFMGVGYTTGTKFAFAQPGLAASDHAACHAVGAPGVQLTTGANADYHAPSDTIDKLDGPGLVEVADAAMEAIAYLAERTDPLTIELGAGGSSAPTEARRASLGTMPDFAFAGPGVLVADVMPGSAAQKSGLLAGDVVLAIDGQKIGDLRSFSELLKAKAPGDAVKVRFRRGTVEQTVDATLTAR